MNRGRPVCSSASYKRGEIVKKKENTTLMFKTKTEVLLGAKTKLPSCIDTIMF